MEDAAGPPPLPPPPQQPQPQQQQQQQRPLGAAAAADVMRLLGEARRALAAQNAPQALQCVVQALTLLRGEGAVLPALRHAAESHYAQRNAPADELAALLSRVTLEAEQQGILQQQQQPPPHQAAWSQQEQAHAWQPQPWQPQPAAPPPPPPPQQQHHLWPPQQQVWGQQQHQVCGQQQHQEWGQQQHQEWGQQQHQEWGQQQHQEWSQQQQQQQQHQRQQDLAPGGASILQETGRGELPGLALADGSSWQCPHCSGVLPLQRRDAHLQAWCPSLQGGG